MGTCRLRKWIEKVSQLRTLAYGKIMPSLTMRGRHSIAM